MYCRTTYRTSVMGLDLGYSKHPSALALLTDTEQIQSPYTWADPTHPKLSHWILSYAKVWPTNTPFTNIARETIALAASYKRQQPNGMLYIVPDTTGLGTPVLESLYHARKAAQVPATIEGLIFTGGHTVSSHKHHNYGLDIYHVPKLQLLNSLSLALESGLLKIPTDLPERDILHAQLAALEVHYPSKSGSQRGPSATQAGLDTTTNRDPIVRLNPDSLRDNPQILGHADLVMSLAIATWRLQLRLRPSIKLL